VEYFQAFAVVPVFFFVILILVLLTFIYLNDLVTEELPVYSDGVTAM
jgi:hypothetical protein